MVTVGKSTDLTHEPEPTDAVVRHDRVTFEGFGAKVEVVSPNTVRRLGGPLAALLYMGVVVASFGISAKVVHGVGGGTSTALAFGAVGAAVALLVVVLVEKSSRSEAPVTSELAVPVAGPDRGGSDRGGSDRGGGAGRGGSDRPGKGRSGPVNLSVRPRRH